MSSIILDYVWLIWVKNEAVIGKETVQAESWLGIAIATLDPPNSLSSNLNFFQSLEVRL